MRGKDNNPSEATKNSIKHMNSAIEKGVVPNDTVVYRGMPSSILGDNPVGKTIKDKGFVSTSLSGEAARQFSNQSGVLAEIKVPKGSRGAYIDSLKSDRTNEQAEFELILPKGSQFKVTSSKKIGDITHVTMELING